MVVRAHELDSDPKRSAPPLPPAERTGWPWTSDATAIHVPNLTTTWPRWSVVIPSLNQGAFIEEAIRSVLMQQYPNLELFVMDGGSTDQTLDVIHKYEPVITHWESCSDRGQAHAINKGFKYATGDVLSFLNSDDALLPGAAFAGIGALLQNADAGIAYGHTQVCEHDTTIGEWRMQPFSRRSLLLSRGPVVFHVPFLKRDVIKRYGGFHEQLRCAFDYEYSCRLMLAGVTPVVVDQLIAKFRVHAASKTSGSQQDASYYEEEAQVCREYGGRWFNYGCRTALRIRLRAAVERSPLAFTLAAYRHAKKKTAGAS